MTNLVKPVRRILCALVALAGLDALGAIAIATDDEGDSSEYGGKAGLATFVVGVFGGLGAGVGAGISRLIPTTRLVYVGRPMSPAQLTLSPLLSPRRQGVALALRF